MTQEKIEKLYETCYMRVFSYAMTLAGERSQAEEITQETFFRAFSKQSEFRGESDEVTWLCAIAKNIWFSEQRKKKAQPIDAASALPDPGISPEESVVRQDESMLIHRLLHRLDEPYREVFTLRTLGQLSFRDIGELFGKSENWACVVYHRARSKIKDEMEA